MLLHRCFRPGPVNLNIAMSFVTVATCAAPTLAACTVAPLGLRCVGVAPFGVVVCLRARLVLFSLVLEREKAVPLLCFAATATAPPSIVVAVLVNTGCTPKCGMAEAGAVLESLALVLEWEHTFVANANSF